MITTNIELINEIRNVKKQYSIEEILSSKTYQEYLKSQAMIALGSASEMRSVKFEIIANKNSKTVAYTNGNKITNNVLCPMVQKVSTLEEKDRINQGKMFHEIGHRFFTDFKTWNVVFNEMQQNGEWHENTEPINHEFYEEVTRNLKEDKNYKNIMFCLYRHITNIYEDEYIEKCMIHVIGGEFLKNLEFTRRNVINSQEPLDKCFQKVKEGKIQWIAVLLNALLINASHGNLIGWQSCKNDKMYLDLIKELDRCKKYADALSNETDINKRITLCNYLLCEMHPYIKYRNSEKSKSKNQQESNSSEEPLSYESTPYPKGETSPIDMKGLKSNESSFSNSSESSKLEELYRKIAEDNLENQASQKLSGEALKIYRNQILKSGFVDWHYIVERELEIDEAMIREYDSYYQEVRPYALKTKRMLLKVLKDKKTEGVEKGHRIGRFDTNSYINQIYTSSGKSFSRNVAPIEKADVVFGLVIDESGSMEGRKIKMAKKSAILFEDILSSLHIPHLILGHTAYRDKSFLFIYHDFENYDNKDKYRLVNMKNRNRNRDGATIHYACEKLKQRDEKHKILIVITDGAPTEIGYHQDKIEEEDVRLTVQEQSKDVLIFGAVIDGNVNTMEYMYQDKILDLTDLDGLPNALCKLIRRNVN